MNFFPIVALTLFSLCVSSNVAYSRSARSQVVARPEWSRLISNRLGFDTGVVYRCTPKCNVEMDGRTYSFDVVSENGVVCHVDSSVILNCRHPNGQFFTVGLLDE